MPGNGPAQQDHPLWQLGDLGEIVTHEGDEWERGGWLNHPAMAGQGSLSSALGAHRGACWATLHGDGQEVCRAASPSMQGQKMRVELGELGGW